MLSYRRLCVVLVALVCASGHSCSDAGAPLPDCGTFGFMPSTDANSSGQAALFQLSFTHKAANCPISCGNYWFVQVLRLLDTDTGEYMQPHDTQVERMVTGQSDEYFNGWAVDRIEGRRLGWYGVTDDFRLPPPSGIPGEVFRLGQGASSAMMHDTLARGERLAGRRVQVIGLTAAVGLDPGTPCANKILGIQKWMVVFGHADALQLDTVAAPVRLPSGQRDLQAFLLAVDEWNNHLDDGRVRLPWANADSNFSLP